MSSGLKWFLGFVLTIFIAVAAVLYLVRFHDGPMEILSGGPFKTGEFVSPPDDWSFLADHATIEMQTMTPLRSRTMWLVVHDNRLFVVSSYMNTPVGKIWKQWPRTVAANNLAVVRVDGKLYKLKLTRFTEGEFIDPVLESFNRKYGSGLTSHGIEEGNTWLFELSSRRR